MPEREVIIHGVDFTAVLTSSEVGRLFNVHSDTVTRWARQGHLASIRTLGGHRRFSLVQVDALLRGQE